MWLDVLFQALIDVAQSEQVSRPARILCVALVSLVFLISIAGLFLLVFVIEGQSLLRRGFFLILDLVLLACYLRFLSIILRKGGKKPS